MVASSMSPPLAPHFDGYSKDIQKRLWNPKMTLPNLNQMVNDYQVTAVEPFGYSILGISEQRN